MARLFPENSFVAPTIGTGKRLVVAEAPGQEEAAVGRPLVGGSGRLFDSLLSKANIKRDSLSICNTIQCRPPDNVYPTDPGAKSYISKADGEAAVAHCYKVHVEPLLRGRDWARVDLLGDKALRTIAGRDGGVYLWRGSPISIPALGDTPKAIATLHPAALMRDQTMLPVAVNDLVKSLVVPPEHYSLYPSIEEVRAFTYEKFAFDIETNMATGEIVMVGLCGAPYFAMAVPFRGPYVAELKRIFANAKEVIGHNAIQFDLPFLRRNGVVLGEAAGRVGGCAVYDTMLMQHLLFPDFPHDLGFLGSQFTNKPAWKELPRPDYTEFSRYCCRDTDVTLQCFNQLKPMLKHEKLERLYELVQVPLARICRLMHDTGIKIDGSKISKVRETLAMEMAELELKLPESLRTQQVPIRKRVPAPPGTRSEKTGKPLKYIMVEDTETVVPWRSTAAKQAYLYGELNLPKQTHAKTGKITVDKTGLEKLYRKTHNPAIKAISELMKRDELMTTFCKEGNVKIDSQHASFNAHGTNSGRLSSSDPNLQNIPESVRHIYVPHRPGWLIVSVDYSGIENRLTAFLANDTKRLNSFLTIPGYSEHKLLASRISGIPYDQIKKSVDPTSLYSKAKHVVHGCLTGDHEVLTPKGWVRFDAYDFTTPIAEWCPLSQNLRFRVPVAKTIEKHVGELYSFLGRSISINATPDHALPTRSSGKKYLRKIAAQVSLSDRLPLTGHLLTEDGVIGDVRLAAAVQADGTLYGNHAVFHLHRKRKIARLERLLLDSSEPVHWNYTIVDCGCGGKRISFNYEPHCILRNKEFCENVLALTRQKAEELLEEVLFWDGHCSSNGSNRKVFLTTSNDSAMWIQTLAHCCGKQALLRRYQRSGRNHYGKKPILVVSFNRRKEARIGCAKKYVQPFSGVVYCLTSSTGFFLCKRNDRIFVSGNSNYGLGPKKASNMYDMDFQETKKLFEAWKAEIADTVRWQEETAARAKSDGFLTTPFGRKRWFWTSSYFTESLSFLPQSTAADIIFRAMIGLMYERIGWPLEKALEVVRVVKALPEPVQLLLQVHDSLVFEAPEAMVPELVKILYSVMEQPWPELGGFSIPIAVEVGPSWGETVTYALPASTNIAMEARKHGN